MTRVIRTVPISTPQQCVSRTVATGWFHGMDRLWQRSKIWRFLCPFVTIPRGIGITSTTCPACPKLRLGLEWHIHSRVSRVNFLIFSSLVEKSDNQIMITRSLAPGDKNRRGRRSEGERGRFDGIEGRKNSGNGHRGQIERKRKICV